MVNNQLSVHPTLVLYNATITYMYSTNNLSNGNFEKLRLCFQTLKWKMMKNVFLRALGIFSIPYSKFLLAFDCSHCFLLLLTVFNLKIYLQSLQNLLRSFSLTYSIKVVSYIDAMFQLIDS